MSDLAGDCLIARLKQDTSGKYKIKDDIEKMRECFFNKSYGRVWVAETTIPYAPFPTGLCSL